VDQPDSHRKLRVLYLTHHSPWPTTSGGRLRDAALLPHLARLADVEAWAVTRTLEQDRAALTHFVPPVRTRLFADEAVRRRFPTRASSVVRALLRQQAERKFFDVIHIEGHYLFHLLPEKCWPRTTVAEHNVESHLLQQGAAHEQFDAVWTHDGEQLARAEEHAWRHAARILTLSEEDRQRILRRVPDAPVGRCLNGADHIPLRLPPMSPSLQILTAAPRLGFLANYAYPPNQDAIRWLLDEIFPRILQRLPATQLVLAGSSLSSVLNGHIQHPHVTTLGWVDQLHTLWNSIDIMLCPLRIGGGVKVKVIEAIRSGCHIVSTPVGVEGLAAAERSAVVCADGVDRFADAVAWLVLDRQLHRDYKDRLARAQRAQPTWAGAAWSLYQHWINLSGDELGSVVGG
jgi:polysaccharide biosynthesis protein PslH